MAGAQVVLLERDEPAITAGPLRVVGHVLVGHGDLLALWPTRAEQSVMAGPRRTSQGSLRGWPVDEAFRAGFGSQALTPSVPDPEITVERPTVCMQLRACRVDVPAVLKLFI